MKTEIIERLQKNKFTVVSYGLVNDNVTDFVIYYDFILIKVRENVNNKSIDMVAELDDLKKTAMTSINTDTSDIINQIFVLINFIYDRINKNQEMFRMVTPLISSIIIPDAKVESIVGNRATLSIKFEKDITGATKEEICDNIIKFIDESSKNLAQYVVSCELDEEKKNEEEENNKSED